MKLLKDGNLEVTVPTGEAYILRPPNGKDLKVISKAAKAPDVDEVDLMFLMLQRFSVHPVITEATLDDMDLEDIRALGDALKTFRVFSDT